MREIRLGPAQAWICEEIREDKARIAALQGAEFAHEFFDFFRNLIPKKPYS